MATVNKLNRNPTGKCARVCADFDSKSFDTSAPGPTQAIHLYWHGNVRFSTFADNNEDVQAIERLPSGTLNNNEISALGIRSDIVLTVVPDCSQSKFDISA